MFFGPGKIFLGPGGPKNVGDLPVCFLDPVGIYFFWTFMCCMYLCWTQGIFLDSQIIVSDIGFFFLVPCTCFVDLASVGSGGKLHCYRRSHWAGCFGPWRLLFLNLYMFFWMKEVADVGGVRRLKQQKRKKWWRGQWGKSTYEAKWMQEIERHRGARESSILK